MPTRNVVVTDHQSRMIDELVESGRYQNASEVLRDGLRLVEERDAAHKAKLAALRAAVQVGDAAFADGRFKAFPDGGAATRHLRTIGDRVLTHRAK